MQKLGVVLHIVALCLGWNLTSEATSFVNRPLQDVIEESAMIVRGRTGTSKAEWGKDDQQKVIYTYTPFTVVDVLKNRTSVSSLPNTILLRQPGGSVDGIEMHVPGTAAFSDNADVVVLLSDKNADGSYDVPGLVTGVYTVKEENDELYLENNLGGEAMYDPHKDTATLSYNSKIPLQVFKKVVQGAKHLPEAKAPQFSASKDAPKPGAFEGDHKEHAHIHHHKVSAKDADHAANEEHESSKAVPIAVGALLLAGIGVLLYMQRGGRK